MTRVVKRVFLFIRKWQLRRLHSYHSWVYQRSYVSHMRSKMWILKHGGWLPHYHLNHTKPERPKEVPVVQYGRYERVAAPSRQYSTRKNVRASRNSRRSHRRR